MPSDLKVKERNASHSEGCYISDTLGKGQLVLIVDDDTDVLPLLSEIVASLNFKPIVFSNARQALNAIKSNQDIELLLTDIEMPMMDGFILAQRAKEANSGIGVVYMSTSVVKSKELTQIDPGAVFLQKPFDWSTLCCALNGAFEKALLKTSSKLIVS